MILLCDRMMCGEMIAKRKAHGLDRYDEVWDGVYVIPPFRDNEHQGILTVVSCIAMLVLGWPERRPWVYAGINVSDRAKDWLYNFRIPDLAVYLPNTHARNHHTHWQGGPDWMLEILTPGDRSRDKFDFYAKVGTRELLVIDRDPWALELYVLKRKKLRLVGRTTPEDAKVLTSTVLPLTYRLVPGETRPLLEINRTDGEASWRV